ncbi:proline utilization protein [Pochonia chlamydosporia 170]|uniref:Proline utilization protein n=1 Tax=Pochonia chlamydosporia 170 TaxID=1380566 RepID=A0A219AS98_METCM|nr:proline utilization protein [Pochonia chlamydosporia 170]OWT43640.1 proline utilization protein [Pochonia chlamydosporia 170]
MLPAELLNVTQTQYLRNDAVHNLLINLTKEEAISFRNRIEQALEDFSGGGERQYQPEPSAVCRPNGQRTLFRTFTSDSSVGAKLVVEPPLRPDGKKDPLHGILVLTDGQGNPSGILDAEEVTGYRTSMNVMVPFSWRKNIDNIIIFGGGMQAMWHTRLILTLRGPEVKNITFLNPVKDQIDALIAKISKENEVRWKSNCSFHFVDTTAADFQQQVEIRMRDVDCVFCTTPSRKALFPSHYLTKRSGGCRQPFISAIGSWQSDMIELDPALLHHAIATGGYNPHTNGSSGAVLVDDGNFALENAGEVVQSEITAKDMVELGQIVALKKAWTENKSLKGIDDMNRFISEGFVVYKSIGVSLTDLVAGKAVLDIANGKNHV